VSSTWKRSRPLPTCRPSRCAPRAAPGGRSLSGMYAANRAWRPKSLAADHLLQRPGSQAQDSARRVMSVRLLFQGAFHRQSSQPRPCPCPLHPGLQGALLVKPAPPTNLDASTENLFSSLVPDSRCERDPAGKGSWPRCHVAPQQQGSAAALSCGAAEGPALRQGMDARWRSIRTDPSQRVCAAAAAAVSQPVTLLTMLPPLSPTHLAPSQRQGPV
jgi:hypothetical protein